VRLSEVFDPAVDTSPLEAEALVKRRRAVVAATLVAGAALLAGTLAAPSGSGLFYGFGLGVAVLWIAGGLGSGPIRSARRPGPVRLAILAPLVLGTALFGVFLAAKLMADRIPVLSSNVSSVLARADAGPRALVLVVAALNAIGEEVFFRGALHSALGKHHPAVWATAIYCVVTIATLNVALVAAALVMGTVFSLERRATGGVLAPILTHLSWSALMILFLPR
jgi:membrane protease YdiL (CAAX protease family)